MGCGVVEELARQYRPEKGRRRLDFNLGRGLQGASPVGRDVGGRSYATHMISRGELD